MATPSPAFLGAAAACGGSGGGPQKSRTIQFATVYPHASQWINERKNKSLILRKFKQELSKKLSFLGKENSPVQQRLCTFVDAAAEASSAKEMMSSVPGQEILQALARRMGAVPAQAFMEQLAARLQAHMAGEAISVLQAPPVLCSKSIPGAAGEVSAPPAEPRAGSGSESESVAKGSDISGPLDVSPSEVSSPHLAESKAQDAVGTSLVEEPALSFAEATAAAMEGVHGVRALPNVAPVEQVRSECSSGLDDVFVDDALVKLTSRDGRTYFWDRRTGACGWELPWGVKAKWTGQKSKDGRTYYWSRDGTSVWKMPPLPSSPLLSMHAEPHAATASIEGSSSNTGGVMPPAACAASSMALASQAPSSAAAHPADVAAASPSPCAEHAPQQGRLVEDVPAPAPAREAPAAKAAAKVAPAEAAPAVEAPAEQAPATKVPAREASAKEAPTGEAPAKEAPTKDVPASAQEAPAAEAAAKAVAAEEVLAVKAPAEQAPAEHAPATKVPAMEASAKEAPTQEVPTKDASTENAPTMEAAVCSKPLQGDVAAAAANISPQPVADVSSKGMGENQDVLEEKDFLEVMGPFAEAVLEFEAAKQARLRPQLAQPPTPSSGGEASARAEASAAAASIENSGEVAREKLGTKLAALKSEISKSIGLREAEACTPASRKRSAPPALRSPTARSHSPAKPASRSRSCSSPRQSSSPSPLRRITSSARTALLTPLKPAAPIRKQPRRAAEDSRATVFERREFATVFERGSSDRSRSPRRPSKLHVAVNPAAESDSMLDKFMTQVKYGVPPGAWAPSSERPGPYSRPSKAGFEASAPSRRSCAGGA